MFPRWLADLTSEPRAANGPMEEKRAAGPNRVIFPPQDDSDAQVPLAVRAGDLLNLTWSTVWDKVDIHVIASLPGSNFTTSKYFTPNMPSTYFMPLRLKPSSYYVNRTDEPIQAMIHFVQHGIISEFVQTQNFTIYQPLNPDQLDDAGIPVDAETWTGSVTLVGTARDDLKPTTPPGATFGKAIRTGNDNPDNGGIAATSVLGAAALSPTGTPVPDPSGLTTGAKVGIGIGATVALAVILGLIAAVVFLARKKRSMQRRSELQPLPYRVSGGLAPLHNSMRAPSYDDPKEMSAHPPSQIVSGTGAGFYAPPYEEKPRPQNRAEAPLSHYSREELTVGLEVPRDVDIPRELPAGEMAWSPVGRSRYESGHTNSSMTLNPRNYM